MASLNKPRIYWTYYPKSKRGYWRVSEMGHRSTATLDAWAVAHDIARAMNRAVDPATGRP